MADCIFKYVVKYIDDIESEKAVSSSTDNASNNVAKADLMLTKRPNLFWTSCGIHILNLMLEEIGKIKLVSFLKFDHSLFFKLLVVTNVIISLNFYFV